MGRRIVKKLKRKCSVCGKPLTIKVYEDGTYEGGHYFGSLKEAMIELGLYNPKYPDEEYEYWECDECYMKENNTPSLGYRSGGRVLDGSENAEPC